MMQQRGHRKKIFNIQDAAGFEKKRKEKFTAFVVIIMKYFCISQCDDYFHANSTLPTTTVFSQIEKTVMSLIVAVKTHTHATRKQHICDIQRSIKGMKTSNTVYSPVKKSLRTGECSCTPAASMKVEVLHFSCILNILLQISSKLIITI